MKHVFFIVWLFAAAPLAAQSNQISTMLQQIAANAALIRSMEKGVSIARHGLNFIGGSKTAEWKLHKLFFDQLRQVNPYVQHNPDASQVMELQQKTAAVCRTAWIQVRDNTFFSAAEIHHMQSVFENVQDHAILLLDELHQTLTPDHLKMTDDERLSSIRSILQNVQADYAFARQYAEAAAVLARQRSIEINDLKTSKSLF